MLSVIIPTLNAAPELAPCLDAICGPEELIVVDGGSTDETVMLARSAGARLVTAAPGRGRQLRAGAASASGDWLLFLHADTVLETGWRSAVEAHLRVHPAKAGYFRFRLRAAERRARLLEQAVAVRCRLLALPYGDQGLLVPRGLYDQVGGYSPMPLMEDVDMARRIGRSRLAAIEAGAWTSARRWKDEGWTRRSVRNLGCLLLYGLGVPSERLVGLYR